MFAGRLALGGGLFEVSAAARSAPPPHPPRPSDVLLDGLAALVTEGRAKAVPTLRQAARTFAEEEIEVEEGLRWGWVAVAPAAVLWDDESFHTIVVRWLESARQGGLLVHLPVYVNQLGLIATWRGDFVTARSLIAEADAIAAATGTTFAPYAAVLLAAFRGVEADALRQMEAAVNGARVAGQGLGIQFCQWAGAILYNGLGRYEEALVQAQLASEEVPELFVSAWPCPR